MTRAHGQGRHVETSAGTDTDTDILTISVSVSVSVRPKLGNKHSGACSACHSEWRAAGLRASLWRSRPAAEQRSPTRASGASNPEPGGLVDLKDLEGPRSCRTATCGAPPTASRRGQACAAPRVAGGAPRPFGCGAWAQQFAAPEMLPQGGASSPHDRPLRPGGRRGAATMTAAAAPAVGKKDLACCRREPTARAEEHSPEAACVTCSCRSRR